MRQCQDHDKANIFQAQSGSRMMYFTQERELQQFYFVNESLNLATLYSKDKMNFESLLDLSSFSFSGIYSEEFHQQRNKFIFEGESYEAIKDGIRNTISGSPDNWKKMAENEWNPLDLVSDTSLFSRLFGGWLNQLQESLFRTLGLIGGIRTLYDILIWLLKYILNKSKSKSEVIILDRNEHFRQRKLKMTNMYNDLEQESAFNLSFKNLNKIE